MLKKEQQLKDLGEQWLVYYAGSYSFITNIPLYRDTKNIKSTYNIYSSLFSFLWNQTVQPTLHFGYNAEFPLTLGQ